MSTEKFLITENAAKQIVKLLQLEEPNAKFRIEVIGGGCSGFKYNLGFDVKSNQNDVIFQKDGALVVIDETSLNSFMQGSILDFVETLGSSYFEIKNPNSSARCGCGSSFSI
ncbi:Iron-sulfur cluster insertion protein erpA [Rickettsiales bacterium Ac37b]|nr:Iron-sulfur cluster insertion protein erpA [Rickettsiales bacterium Ac37b]